MGQLLPAFPEGLAVGVVEARDLGAFDARLAGNLAQPVVRFGLIILFDGVEGHDAEAGGIQGIPY